jgi:serine/threonine protein phosphatase 1
MGRTLVVGDIHGALKALNQVFGLASVNSYDRLIFLGDYVDGWSQSAQVVEFVIQLSKHQECIVIKGNHDVWCEHWLRTGEANATWVQHGGIETMESYANFDEAQKLKHLLFFESMCYFHIDELKRLYIHAGFTSMHGPAYEMSQAIVNWDRTLWELALAKDPAISPESPYYPKRLQLFSEIFIGHTPTLFVGENLPMNRCNVWNIDTGAAFYGKLSLMDVDTKEYWQSDGVRELYPYEKGRNRI